MHMTGPRFIFDLPSFTQNPRRTTAGNNEVHEQLWQRNLFQVLKTMQFHTLDSKELDYISNDPSLGQAAAI